MPVAVTFPCGGRKSMSERSILSGSTAILVLGMHRSGTSALTGCLAKLGVTLGSEGSFLAPRHDNPTGFWEHSGVYAAHERLLGRLETAWDNSGPMPTDWLSHPAVATAKSELRSLLEAEMVGSRIWAVKDPRICRLLPMWQDLLETMGVRCLPLFCVRHPFEVAKSLEIRNGFSITKGLALWLRHVTEAEAATRLSRRVLVSYEALLADWRIQLERVREFFQLDWPVEADKAGTDVDEFLSGDERHHREGNQSNDSLPEIVASAYAGLLQAMDGQWSEIEELSVENRRNCEIYDEAFIEAFNPRISINTDAIYEFSRALENQKDWFNAVSAYWLERREADQAFDAIKSALDIKVKEVERAHAANAELSMLLDSAKQQETRLDDAIALCNLHIAGLDHRIAEMDQKLSIGRSTIASLQAAVVDQDRTITTLRNEKAAADNSLKENSAQIVELQSGLSRMSGEYQQLGASSQKAKWLIKRLLLKMIGKD